MLDRGFEAYHKIQPVKNRSYILTLPVVGGKEQTVLCTNTSEISAIMPRDISAEACDITIEAPQFLYAPIENGEIIGRLVCRANGEIIGETDIAAEYSVPAIKYKKSFWQRIRDFFSGIF